MVNEFIFHWKPGDRNVETWGQTGRFLTLRTETSPHYYRARYDDPQSEILITQNPSPIRSFLFPQS